MRFRLSRALFDERGQTLLVLTFLVLLVIGALATREMMVNSFLRTVSQNTIEDKMAKEMSESGLQEAVELVRRLDKKLDLNYDGVVDSKDGPYTSDTRQMDGGSYNFRITGHYANEKLVYFRFTHNGNPNWSNLAASLIEDAGNNPITIGQFAFDAPQPDPLDFQYRTSMYPGDNLYTVEATLQNNPGASQSLWIRVRAADNPEPFTQTAPVSGVDAEIVFPISPTGLPPQTQSISPQVEATQTIGARAFEDDVFEIEASGMSGDQRHNLDVFVKRQDLLKYAFFSSTDLVFLSGATINGFVYAGTNLVLNAGDPVLPTTFRKPVKVLGSVQESAGCGTFNSWPPPDPNACLGQYKRGVAFGGSPIRLPAATKMDQIKAIAEDPSEKGGWYVAGPLSLDLSLFDFDPNDGTADLMYDRGGPAEHSLPAKFNGLVFADGPVEIVGGTLRGKCLTVYSRDLITIHNSIYTGTTYDTREPVNVGLVSGLSVQIDPASPRILHIHAALFAAYDGSLPGNWQALLDMSNPRNSHPPRLSVAVPGTDRGTGVNLPASGRDGQIGGCDYDGTVLAGGLYACGNTGLREVGVYDVDDDGILEILDPNDPNSLPDRFGWDEGAVAHDDDPDNPDNLFFLLIRGPIIIAHTGTAGTWSWLGNAPPPVGYAGTTAPGHPEIPRQTRSYQYDPDITRYPPPYFPIPLNATQALSYTESIVDERLVQPTPGPTPEPTPEF
jgi:hypothetical protein